jgi:hypothetical protein
MKQVISDKFSNALLKELHSRKRSLLIKHFPMLSHCPHNNYLSLFNYIDRIPECFFLEGVFHEYLGWLESQHKSNSMGLKNYFIENEGEFNKAFLFLGEINRYSWHDSFEEVDDYERIRFIDQQVHPVYLRLIEAVFYPFTHLIAFFSRKSRGKQTDGLEVFNTVEEVRDTDFSSLVDLYRNTVRNGIAHGGITYIEKEIRYRDDKGNEEVLSDNQIIRLVDDLVDACNGMALALKIFIFSHINDGYTLPKQVFLEELQAETDTPWWHIVGCVPSRFASQNQLIIYARPNSRDYYKVLYSTFLSGVLAEYFAPGYDRYFFSLRSRKALPSWAAFDGRKLLEIRNKDTKTLADYQGALENNLVFYTPQPRLPRFLGVLDTFIQSFRIHWPLVLSDLREKLGRPDIRVRTSKIHRVGWGVVLNSSVFIARSQESLNQDLVRRNCNRIIHAALSNARSDSSLMNAARYLPLRFARIAIFRRNYRKRRLNNFGLGADLVAVVQVKRLTRIRAPDIYGSQIEIKGKYRIAWNAAWLETKGNRY